MNPEGKNDSADRKKRNARLILGLFDPEGRVRRPVGIMSETGLSRKTVFLHLGDLCRAKKIRKLRRGIYQIWRPRLSKDRPIVVVPKAGEILREGVHYDIGGTIILVKGPKNRYSFP